MIRLPCMFDKGEETFFFFKVKGFEYVIIVFNQPVLI